MKRLLAYTSISHMGFILLAIYAGNILTFQGLMIMMLAHGLSSAALFIMSGQVYERLHTRDTFNGWSSWSTAILAILPDVLCCSACWCTRSR
jgi:NADH:ubiquinone oxidoreductase subunit 4 (subunit M)